MHCRHRTDGASYDVEPMSSLYAPTMTAWWWRFSMSRGDATHGRCWKSNAIRCSLVASTSGSHSGVTRLPVRWRRMDLFDSQLSAGDAAISDQHERYGFICVVCE
jgi:hypothetical protein